MPTFGWTHIEPRTLDLAVKGGLARAIGGAWTVDEASAADFRALIIYSLWAVNQLRWQSSTKTEAVPISGDDGETMGASLTFYDMPANGWRGAWHEQAATAILGTWFLLSRSEFPSSADFTTVGGGDATPQEGGDVGALPAAAIVIIKVTGIIAATIAASYCAEKAMPILDRELTRRAEARKLLETQAQLVTLADQHRQRETMNGGAPLPPNQFEQAALEALKGAQKAFVKSEVKPAEPPKEPPPLSHTISLAAIAAVALVAVVVLKR